MELRHLRYFVGVGETLNFTRAAERLRVAQPSLSRQIRQLEAEVGVTLLERSARGVRLTDAGREFLDEARTILRRSEEAVRMAQSAGARGGGVLNVGYVWGLFHGLVPGMVERFRRMAPDIAVNLLDLTSAQQVDALRDGRIDLGYIGFGEEADAAGLARRKVGACSWVAALPEGHPAGRRKTVSMRALADGTFLTISEAAYPGAARWIASVFAAAGYRPRVVQAADRGHTLLALVAAGCGVALVPESLASLPHQGVVLKPLERVMKADLYVAWSEARRSMARDRYLQAAGTEEHATATGQPRTGRG